MPRSIERNMILHLYKHNSIETKLTKSNSSMPFNCTSPVSTSTHSSFCSIPNLTSTHYIQRVQTLHWQSRHSFALPLFSSLLQPIVHLLALPECLIAANMSSKLLLKAKELLDTFVKTMHMLWLDWSGTFACFSVLLHVSCGCRRAIELVWSLIYSISDRQICDKTHILNGCGGEEKRRNKSYISLYVIIGS